eukprot:301164-Rhodomonas_salina.1
MAQTWMCAMMSSLVAARPTSAPHMQTHISTPTTTTTNASSQRIPRHTPLVLRHALQSHALRLELLVHADLKVRPQQNLPLHLRRHPLDQQKVLELLHRKRLFPALPRQRALRRRAEKEGKNANRTEQK